MDKLHCRIGGLIAIYKFKVINDLSYNFFIFRSYLNFSILSKFILVMKGNIFIYLLQPILNILHLWLDALAHYTD